MPLLYSSWGCYLSQYSAHNSSDLLLLGEPCSLRLADLLPEQSIHRVVWVGAAIQAACLLLSVGTLVKLQLSAPANLLGSVSGLAYLNVISFNACQLATSFDPNRATQALALPVFALLTGIITFNVYYIVILMVYRMWYSVLLEFERKMNPWFKPLYGWIMFAQLAVLSILYCIPTKDSTLNGVQILLLVLEAVFLGSINLWFGVRLYLSILSHESQVKLQKQRSSHKGTINKIRLLLVASTITLIVSVITNIDRSTVYFTSSQSNTVHTESEISSDFTIFMIFAYFIAIVINVLCCWTFWPRNSKSKSTVRLQEATPKVEVSKTPS